MNENNNIPKLLPADQLQDIYRQHRYGRGYYRYFDREGHLAWSNKDGCNHYTWYLYNDLGEIIEMGDSFVNAGALGHVVTVGQCTTAEAGEYIRSKAGRDNVLRLAPPATVGSIAIIPAEQVAASAPSAELQAITMQADIILAKTYLPSIPSAKSQFGTSQSNYPGPEISIIANNTSFSHQLLKAIFTVAPERNGRLQLSPFLQQATTHCKQQLSFHNIPAHYYQLFRYSYHQHITNTTAVSRQPLNNARPGTLYLHSPPLQNTS